MWKQLAVKKHLIWFITFECSIILFMKIDHAYGSFLNEFYSSALDM